MKMVISWNNSIYTNRTKLLSQNIEFWGCLSWMHYASRSTKPNVSKLNGKHRKVVQHPDYVLYFGDFTQLNQFNLNPYYSKKKCTRCTEYIHILTTIMVCIRKRTDANVIQWLLLVHKEWENISHTPKQAKQRQISSCKSV